MEKIRQAQPTTSNPVPYFRLATPGGNSVANNDFFGKKTLFFLWAAWAKSKKLLAKFDKIKGYSKVAIAFDVIGVSPVMKFVTGNNTKSLVLIDNCALLSRVWGIKKIPQLIIQDENGNLCADKINFPVKPLEKLEIARTSPKVELLLQYVTNLLGRKKTGEAIQTLAEAFRLDPKNQIIRGQMQVLKNPERFYK